MDERRARLVAWVAAHVAPHEHAVRAWLSNSALTREEIDDLVQEAYCKLSAVNGFEQIAAPRAYFFQIVRNLLVEQIRRARIVRFETVAEVDALSVCSDEPSPERVAAARQDLARVRRLMAVLPERARRVLELRKIEGRSQKEIAEALGVTESVVENEAVKAIRLILKGMREESGPNPNSGGEAKDGRSRTRRNH